jgi:hypothetical protein
MNGAARPKSARRLATKRRGYTGTLATPIVRAAPPTFEGAVTEKRVKEFWRKYEQHESKAERRVKRQIEQKMALLMKHFGLGKESGPWALAQALANEHVPGLRIVPEERKAKKGRKKEWHGGKLRALYDTVQSVKHLHKFNDRRALRFVAKEFKKDWGPPAHHKGSNENWLETLESRLQDAKQYVRRIDALHESLHVSRGALKK